MTRHSGSRVWKWRAGHTRSMSLLRNHYHLRRSRITLPVLSAFCILIVMGAPICRADAVPESNVIAHASDDMLWVAQVLPAPEMKPAGERTTIRYRALNTADQSWHELDPLNGTHVVQIANR